jgi:hypothetical protein
VIRTRCHCGSVSIELPRRPRTITECNCSICRRYGARWAYYLEGSVKVRSPSRAMQPYARGRMLNFDRCRRCGCVMLWRLQRSAGAGSRMGVNMRMVEDPATLANITIRRFDGARSWKDKGTHSLRQPEW